MSTLASLVLKDWRKAMLLDVCSHEVFRLSFCKPKWLGQRKQREQRSNSKMYSHLHRNPTPRTSCRGKCRPGLYLLNFVCLSSSGWIVQVHRARHIPQRTWSWRKKKNEEGTGGGDFFLTLLILLFSFHLPESSWMEADSIHAVARMRQQLSLGCSPSLLKGRYQVSNSFGWLDTMGSSKKRVLNRWTYLLFLAAVTSKAPDYFFFLQKP